MVGEPVQQGSGEAFRQRIISVASRRSGPDHPARPWATTLSQLGTHCAEGTAHEAKPASSGGQADHEGTLAGNTEGEAQGYVHPRNSTGVGDPRATVRRYLDADNPPTRQVRIASTTLI